MRNTQLSISTQNVNTAVAAWTVDALSTTVAVKREDVRPGIFYWAVNTANLASEPELLSSREAKSAEEGIALFVFEDTARNFQKLQKAQHQH